MFFKSTNVSIASRDAESGVEVTDKFLKEACDSYMSKGKYRGGKKHLLVNTGYHEFKENMFSSQEKVLKEPPAGNPGLKRGRTDGIPGGKVQAEKGNKEE